jgi:hypothetical protein
MTSMHFSDRVDELLVALAAYEAVPNLLAAYASVRRYLERRLPEP